jgi:peptidoglycan hydrolase-like protein with peptidoglycan-binding domain
MRKILTFAAALAMAGLAWAGGSTTKPAQIKVLAKKAATATSARRTAAAPAVRPAVAKKPATGAGTAAAKRGKRAPVGRTTWRTRQTAPTPDRYREIQEALAARGYLSSEEANGTWGPSSAEALKKFQAEQTLESTGRIDSLSLIALGLGPKHDSSVPRVVDGNVQTEYGRN